MKKWLALLTFVLVFPLSVSASTICQGTTSCTKTEVGPFMQGISVQCGNVGDCSIRDIEQVFANVGNWIVGIIGALVFLMYIYGGIMYLTGGANPDGIKKGKQALKISTMGLIIVFGAYAGIVTLTTAIQTGKVTTETDQYVTCGPGDVNEGLACGYNSVCSKGGACVSKCIAAHGSDTLTVDNGMQEFYYACIDTNESFDGGFVTVESCEQNLCPGPDEVQCCLMHINQHNSPVLTH